MLNDNRSLYTLYRLDRPICVCALNTMPVSTLEHARRPPYDVSLRLLEERRLFSRGTSLRDSLFRGRMTGRHRFSRFVGSLTLLGTPDTTRRELQLCNRILLVMYAEGGLLNRYLPGRLRVRSHRANKREIGLSADTRMIFAISGGTFIRKHL